MALVETEALILKTYPLAEADKIVVFLTGEHGLIRGVAKGAKRLKSRFGGTLEIFSIVDLTYFQKEERELVSVRNLELKKSYFANAGNLLFLQKISYLAELLVEFAPPHEPNERIYRMAQVCLQAADENPENLDAIVLYFEIWLLKLSGYLPLWINCTECRREFNQSEDANLQINFQLLCQNCRKSKNGFVVSATERMIFQKAQTTSPEKFINFVSDKSSEIIVVSQVLKRIISQILGKDGIVEKSLTLVS